VRCCHRILSRVRHASIGVSGKSAFEDTQTSESVDWFVSTLNRTTDFVRIELHFHPQITYAKTYALAL
jgi:hypothetical protein